MSDNDADLKAFDQEFDGEDVLSRIRGNAGQRDQRGSRRN
jgi:hypothetical protein